MDLAERNLTFAESEDYYVYGHDNTRATWLLAAALSGEAVFAVFALGLCCLRCMRRRVQTATDPRPRVIRLIVRLSSGYSSLRTGCSFRSTHLACRALATLSRGAFAVAYYLAFVHHQRLNFGELSSATDNTASITRNGFGPMPNACFAESDLMWGAFVLYAKQGFLGLGSGLHLASCCLLFIRRSRRTVVLLAAAFTIAGVGGGVAAGLKLNGEAITLEAMRTAESLVFTIGTGLIGAYISAALGLQPSLRDLKSPIGLMRACCRGVQRGARTVRGAGGAGGWQPASKALARSSCCGAVLFNIAGIFFGISSLVRDMLFDGIKIYGSNCDSPCPNNCPLPPKFNHNALAYALQLGGWVLFDVSMHFLLPMAEADYAPLGGGNKVVPASALPPTELAEATPDGGGSRPGSDAGSTAAEAAEAAAPAFAARAGSKSGGDGAEEGGVVEDDVKEEDVEGDENDEDEDEEGGAGEEGEGGDDDDEEDEESD